ncbi:hypothetical protein ACFC18_00600 [Streptomyces sp. NPDC056121]|uniref:hypothetical protein n=1 Tax=Streptomyces TaxID=1883 RepID=UPI001D0B6C34|nr:MULTISPECIES: hypothetical protein [Streptomyces]MCX5087038.1 hypothetical protein [Streptomyces sp. NBC_00401]UDM01972.1 hypothetical protein LGI35_28740 [Streptomyces longhuiensis]
MAALLWLLIPLVAAVGAGLWGSWAARNRKTGDVSELNGYARFREAMERTHAGTETDPLGPTAGSMPGVESRTDAPAVH